MNTLKLKKILESLQNSEYFIDDFYLPEFGSMNKFDTESLTRFLNEISKYIPNYVKFKNVHGIETQRGIRRLYGEQAKETIKQIFSDVEESLQYKVEKILSHYGELVDIDYVPYLKSNKDILHKLYEPFYNSDMLTIITMFFMKNPFGVIKLKLDDNRGVIGFDLISKTKKDISKLSKEVDVLYLYKDYYDESDDKPKGVTNIDDVLENKYFNNTPAITKLLTEIFVIHQYVLNREIDLDFEICLEPCADSTYLSYRL